MLGHLPFQPVQCPLFHQEHRQHLRQGLQSCHLPLDPEAVGGTLIKAHNPPIYPLVLDGALVGIDIVDPPAAITDGAGLAFLGLGKKKDEED